MVADQILPLFSDLMKQVHFSIVKHLESVLDKSVIKLLNEQKYLKNREEIQREKLARRDNVGPVASLNGPAVIVRGEEGVEHRQQQSDVELQLAVKSSNQEKEILDLKNTIRSLKSVGVVQPVVGSVIDLEKLELEKVNEELRLDIGLLQAQLAAVQNNFLVQITLNEQLERFQRERQLLQEENIELRKGCEALQMVESEISNIQLREQKNANEFNEQIEQLTQQLESTVASNKEFERVNGELQEGCAVNVNRVVELEKVNEELRDDYQNKLNEMGEMAEQATLFMQELIRKNEVLEAEREQQKQEMNELKNIVQTMKAMTKLAIIPEQETVLLEKLEQLEHNNRELVEDQKKQATAQQIVFVRLNTLSKAAEEQKSKHEKEISDLHIAAEKSIQEIRDDYQNKLNEIGELQEQVTQQLEDGIKENTELRNRMKLQIVELDSAKQRNVELVTEKQMMNEEMIGKLNQLNEMASIQQSKYEKDLKTAVEKIEHEIRDGKQREILELQKVNEEMRNRLKESDEIAAAEKSKHEKEIFDLNTSAGIVREGIVSRNSELLSHNIELVEELRREKQRYGEFSEIQNTNEKNIAIEVRKLIDELQNAKDSNTELTETQKVNEEMRNRLKESDEIAAAEILELKTEITRLKMDKPEKNDFVTTRMLQKEIDELQSGKTSMEQQNVALIEQVKMLEMQLQRVKKEEENVSRIISINEANQLEIANTRVAKLEEELTNAKLNNVELGSSLRNTTAESLKFQTDLVEVQKQLEAEKNGNLILTDQIDKFTQEQQAQLEVELKDKEQLFLEIKNRQQAEVNLVKASEEIYKLRNMQLQDKQKMEKIQKEYEVELEAINQAEREEKIRLNRVITELENVKQNQVEAFNEQKKQYIDEIQLLTQNFNNQETSHTQQLDILRQKLQSAAQEAEKNDKAHTDQVKQLKEDTSKIQKQYAAELEQTNTQKQQAELSLAQIRAELEQKFYDKVMELNMKEIEFNQTKYSLGNQYDVALANLELREKALNEEKLQLQTYSNQVQTALQEREQTLHQQQAAVTELGKEIFLKTQNMERLENDNNALRDRIEVFEADRSRFDTITETLRNENKTLTNDLQEQIQKLHERHNTDVQNNSTLQAQINDLNEELEISRRELDAEKQEILNKVKLSNNDNERIRAANTDVTNENTHLKQKLETLTAINKSLE